MSPSIPLSPLPTPFPSFTPPPPRKPHLILIITSLYLGTFLVALGTIILNPILLTITQTFHTIDHLAWYGSAYLLALTALQPTLGKLYKVGNVKVLYLVSVGVFEAQLTNDAQVGSGLFTLLDIDTSHGVWAAYFTICGVGTGCAINLPYTAVSAVLKEEDMVPGNALLQFAFQLGGAVSLCISQAILLGRLTVYAKSSLPDTRVELSSDGVKRLAHQKAIRDVFVFLLVTSGLALLASFGLEHKNVKKIEEEQKAGRARLAEVE